MYVKDIDTIAYVPNLSETHYDYIELYEKLQKCGKSLSYSGNIDEIRKAYPRLPPEKTLYCLDTQFAGDYYKLDRWMRKQYP